jgi:hypothetical protein
VSAQDVDCFVENIFNFPTLAEAYRIAALDIVGQRKQAARGLPGRLLDRGTAHGATPSAPTP